MNRQNLFADAWDGESERRDPAASLLAAGDARMGATLYELAPGATGMGCCTCTSGRRRCSSS